MKRALIYLSIAAVSLSACRKDENNPAFIQEVDDIATQNSNDDKAIEKYLNEHYLDDIGRIKSFSSSDTSDDNYKKLSELNPQKLASGVVVIVRENAQPTDGKEIGTTDKISFMHRTTAFLSQEDNGIKYSSEINFYEKNHINTSAVPEVDPTYYHATETKLNGKAKSYFEIEGLQEGLKYFKSFNKEVSENYNLQGVIIVPSKLAFARDDHYPYSGINWRNRTFVFNFQVYKSEER